MSPFRSGVTVTLGFASGSVRQVDARAGKQRRDRRPSPTSPGIMIIPLGIGIGMPP